MLCPCSALPTADQNAVTESAVTTVSSSLFQPATILTKNEFLYCSVLLSWNLQTTRVSNFLSGDGFVITAVVKGGRTYSSSILSAGVRKFLGAWLGCGPSQSCRGLSAVAASYRFLQWWQVQLLEHMSHTSCLSRPVVSLDVYNIRPVTHQTSTSLFHSK